MSPKSQDSALSASLLDTPRASCGERRRQSILWLMKDKTNREHQGSVTRRRFVRLTIGGGAAVLAGGSMIVRAASDASTQGSSIFKIGGDLPVNRLGFGAMRITGDGIWGWPKDRDEARKVLKR